MIRIISSFFLMLFFLAGTNVSSANPVPASGVPASASVSAPLTSVNQSLNLAVQDTTVKLQNIAVKWLSAFILLQFFITNFAHLKSGGEIDSVVYKFIGSMAWFSICFLIMNNGAQFLSDVSSGFFTTASGIAGGGGTFDTADILNKGCASAADLIQKVTSAASYVSLIPAAILAGLLGLIIMGVAAMIAFKLFLIKIEVMLLIMMAPLSFAFLGLNTMRDQGIAPFKSLISLMYRIILLAVIMSAMGSVGRNLDTVIASVDKASFVSGLWQSLFGAVVAFALLGYLAYKSDSMAANLSSGSTSLGTGDVAGAIGGAVAGAIGGAAVVAAASGGKSMSDVIKSMSGGAGGGASDASGGRGAGGSGGAPVGEAPKPSMSAGGAYGGGASNASGGGSGGGAPRQEAEAAAGPSPAETAAGGSGGNPSGTQTPSPAETAAGGSGGNPSGTQTPSPAETAAGGGNAGSGATAGIGGAGSSTLEANLGKLVDQLSQQNAPRKPSLKDHLRDINQHATHERANVSVSINPNVE